MPWLKLAGCLTVLCVGAAAAVSAVGFERRRLSVLDGWLELLFYIRSQIDCYLKPLDEILLDADERLLIACMASSKQRSLNGLLTSSAPWLDRESQRLLETMLRELGHSYREEQLKRCDFYAEALRSIREKVAAQLPSRIKLCVSLCLCAALGTVILLW